MSATIKLLMFSLLLFSTTYLFAQEEEVLPELPRTILLAHHFAKAQSLSSSARLSLVQALSTTVSRIESTIYIQSMEVSSNASSELLATAKGLGASLVLLMEYSLTSTDELAAQVAFIDPEAGIEIKRILGSGIVDERNRNLGPAFFDGLVPLLTSKIGPVRSSATVRIQAVEGAQVWFNGREYKLDKSATLELVTASGRYAQVESYVPGFFKTTQQYFIESRPENDVQVIILEQAPHLNPFVLESSLLWVNYPGFQLWWPIEIDKLYWGPGAHVFSFGFGYMTDYKPMQSLYQDLHLLEPGLGVLWYPFGKSLDWRFSLGAKGLLRIDTASKYVLDLLTPLVVQTHLGLELKTEKSIALYFDLVSRLNVSLDSRLATSEETIDFDTDTIDQEFSLEELSRMKMVLGPLLIEPFVPVFGIRLQL